MKPHRDFILKGIVVSGSRKAAYFTQLDWVMKQCEAKLGFKPYPGTLNIDIHPAGLPDIESKGENGFFELIPPDPSFCSSRMLPVAIEGLQAAVIMPEERVRIHGIRIIEIIAPVNLKETLSIKDGDTVTLTFAG